MLALPYSYLDCNFVVTLHCQLWGQLSAARLSVSHGYEYT
jgi:hypothetical protein